MSELTITDIQRYCVRMAAHYAAEIQQTKQRTTAYDVRANDYIVVCEKAASRFRDLAQALSEGRLPA